MFRTRNVGRPIPNTPWIKSKNGKVAIELQQAPNGLSAQIQRFVCSLKHEVAESDLNAATDSDTSIFDRPQREMRLLSTGGSKSHTDQDEVSSSIAIFFGRCSATILVFLTNHSFG